MPTLITVHVNSKLNPYKQYFEMCCFKKYSLVSILIISSAFFIKCISAQTCELSINTDLTKKVPMFIDRIDGRTILETNSKDESLLLQKGDSIYLTCPGNANEVIGYSSKMVLATCNIGSLFYINGNTRPIPITNVECLQYPQSYTTVIGTCANNRGQLLEIGFELSNTQNPQIQLCFDMEHKNTHWAKSLVIRQNPTPCTNSNIQFDKVYFGTINPDDRYLKQNQYIHYGNKLTKSHLISKCNFLDAASKRMTHYYINTAPLWTPFHKGNWRNLENLIKKQMASRQTYFHSYTGTYDVLQINGKNITLDSSGKMPIPLQMWKVIIDGDTGKGVAFIGVNDMYQLYPTICTDFCHHVSWLESFQQSRRNLKDGIIYCCAIDDLQKVPNIVLPEFTEWKGTFLY